MTAIADFCTTIRDWLSRSASEYADPLVTSWVRIAEGEISDLIRIRDNTSSGLVSIAAGEGTLPSDFEEARFITNAAGRELKYMPLPEYTARKRELAASVAHYYAIMGDTVYVGGGKLDGQSIDVTYYSRVPVLDADPTWLSTKYPQVLIGMTMAAAELFGVDDERSASLANAAMLKIDKLNTAHRMAEASGSRLRHRPKSLG